MTYYKDAKEVAAFLYCSSNIEERAFSLYRTLSDKIEDPAVKASMLYIAYDSLKHSVIMRLIAETISRSKPKPEDCEKKLKGAWERIISFAKETSAKQKITAEELPNLMRQLAGFENALSEEYFILIQLKTLQFMTKEVAKIYNVDLQNLKNVLDLIIKDEENHREILMSIEDQSAPDDIVKDNTPIVRYQNPDAW